MRFTYLKLVNNVCIYNGLNMNEIFIDFTKCMNNIILIKGLNGSGKSTIMNSLNPLPDYNSIIPGKEGVKEVGIVNNNVEYHIKIQYPLKANGDDRATTKAYVRKVIGEESIELNPNGNFGSYKDIIYEELSLDSNFIALSQLGSEDRGLVERTPSERKGLLNSIVDKLEVYNNIHKTLSKRSSSFKSIVNSLVNKIDNIGDMEGILQALKSIENRINNMMNDKDIILEQLASNKSTISLIDTDGSIQNKYSIMYNEISNIDKSIDIIDNKIELYIKGLDIDKSDLGHIFSDKYSNTLNIINDIKNNITITENSTISLLNSREEYSKSIQKKEQRLYSLEDVKDYNVLKSEIDNKRLLVNNYEDIFRKIGFKDKVTLSKDEYIIGLDTLKEVKDTIDIIKANVSYSILKATIDEFILKDTIINIPELISLIEEKKDLKRNLESSLFEYTTLLNISQKLNIRPTNCSIDTCEFIKDAVDANNKNPKENIDRLEFEISQIDIEISDITKHRDYLLEINECKINISKILRSLNSNNHIIKRLPNTTNIITIPILLDRIISFDSFEEIDELYRYIEYCDIFNDYSIQVDILNNLESECNKYSGRDEIISELNNDILELSNKVDDISKSINLNNSKIEEDNINLITMNKDLETYTNVLNIINERKTLENTKANILSEFYAIQINMEKIKVCRDNIYELDIKLKDFNSTLEPLMQERDELNHAVRLLEEYKRDLDLYNKKFELVKDVRYYCTPSTGIQLLFINVYMNKTLSMANELLSHVFEGEFTLLPYIINEKEFRIPCIGGGLPRDDISNLSNAQKSIMSMILSFVLLKQSSTEYNILRLDEIDSMLDEINRSGFNNLIEMLMNILDIEQCIMISHNSEQDSSNCDLILLKTDPSQSHTGNVIYRY